MQLERDYESVFKLLWGGNPIMPTKRFEEVERPSQVSHSVCGLSMNGSHIHITGTAYTENVEKEQLILLLKKRKSTISYTIPIQWESESKWQGICRIDELTLGRGIWDFYFQYEGKNFRTKLDEEVTTHSYGIVKQSTKTMEFTTYRTIKDSLSIKIEKASLSLNDLTVTSDSSNKHVTIRGSITFPMFSNGFALDDMTMVMIQRKKRVRVDFPVEFVGEQDKYKLLLECDYKKLIHSSESSQMIWDGYLEVISHGEIYLFRIHLNESITTINLENDSRTEFELPSIHEIRFYKTINHHLSVRQNRAPIDRNVKDITFDKGHLLIDGFAYLDTTIEKANDVRKIIIRHRLSQKEYVVNLKTPQSTDFNKQNVKENKFHFNLKVPLAELPGMTTSEFEIYDIIIQIEYNNETYARHMGFEKYKYNKDDVLSQTMIKKNNHYRKMYLGLTPRGNLKMETFHLSKSAYFYMKYLQKIDVRLNGSKDIWLIGERTDTAQDTGYHFFKYCREHHPDLDIYYVIHPKSKDMKNLEGLGHVIKHGSVEHIRKSFLANTFIGSHDLDNILPLKGFEFDNYVKGERVFLQHGVLGRKKVEYDKTYYKYPFDLFCVSSKDEKKLVERQFKYDPKDVQVTGLSRFDQLLKPHQTTSSILLIPTWRDWFRVDSVFKETDFYKRYYSLLTNSQLHKLLEEHELTLNVYLHYRMQSFMNEFNDINTTRINFIPFEEKDVQELLIESQLMITDYSSVSFDFNYMAKPVIFYHFDDHLFFLNGMLRPKEETFLGDICRHEDEVIQAIKQYVQNNFKEREDVQYKKNHVFSHIDTKNNFRIFEAIKKITK